MLFASEIFWKADASNSEKRNASIQSKDAQSLAKVGSLLYCSGKGPPRPLHLCWKLESPWIRKMQVHKLDDKRIEMAKTGECSLKPSTVLNRFRYLRLSFVQWPFRSSTVSVAMQQSPRKMSLVSPGTEAQITTLSILAQIASSYEMLEDFMLKIFPSWILRLSCDEMKAVREPPGGR